MPVPPDPDSFDKVNYVIEAWTQACEAPWYIYVSTLKPALLAAFITLLTFGWDDVLRGYARPPDRHSRRRTGKKRGKGGVRVRGIPELGELGGRQLPGSSAVRGINWPGAARTLWRIDSLVQGVLFALLIAEVTAEFGFQWTSLLYKTRWCQDSARGRFSWQKGGRELVTPGVWNEIAYTSKDYQFPFPNWIVTFGNTGIKGATISFSIGWEPLIPSAPPTSYSSRLVDKITGQVFSETGPTLPDSDGKAVHVVSADVPVNRVFGVQGFAAGNWAYAQDGVVLGMEDIL